MNLKKEVEKELGQGLRSSQVAALIVVLQRVIDKLQADKSDGKPR